MKYRLEETNGGKIKNFYFVYKGYLCRATWYGEHWCGYVRLPKKHGLVDYDYTHCYLDIAVHGGLTYSEWEGNRKWFGFDFNHLCDIYKKYDVFDVERECISMVNQFISY